MKKVAIDFESADPAACLHAWLSVHAGADPDGDHLAAALTTRQRWLALEKQHEPHEPGAARVLAVCNAVVELSSAEDWAAMERQVRRLLQSAKGLRAFLDENSDIPKTAIAKQDGFRAISKMHGRDTHKAAEAFAFGPPEVFNRIESCWHDLQKLAADAIAISHYEPKRGRPEQPGLAAAAKHLRHLHQMFGDWRLAVAAYNCGEGTVQKTLKRYQAKSYARIATHLPAETQMYVPKVAATILQREGKQLEKLKAE